MGVTVVAGGALLLAVLGLFVGVPWFFNRLSPMVDGRRRARDDHYFVADQCATGLMSRYRRLNRHLPSNPRCKFCLVPFGGVGRVLRIRPSRKNPNFCMGCFEMAPLGGTDMEVGVLFADLRGFTAWCEHQSSDAIERGLNRFYAVTASLITDADGLLDKLIGDEAMGLFLPAFRSLGDRTCEVMVTVAQKIVRELHASTGDEDCLPVGVGLNFGVARVGNVGAGAVKDFTAVGDVVNTAARLRARAAPGEIVMSEAVYERARDNCLNAVQTRFDLKGKTDATAAHVLFVQGSGKSVE